MKEKEIKVEKVNRKKNPKNNKEKKKKENDILDISLIIQSGEVA
jgi:hypothetical protein